MPNEILTHDMVAKEAAARLLETSVFAKSINRDREQEFNSDKGGYKVGDTVRIKIPPLPQVTDGKTFSDDDAALNAKEKHINLTVDTQKHVPLLFGAAERTLSITKFKERFLNPAIDSLAAVVDADLMKRAIISVNNHTLIGGSEPHPISPWNRIRKQMNRNLAPKGRRWSILPTEMNNTLVEGSSTLFNPTAEIAKQYKEGYIGKAAGFEFVESENIYRFQNGSNVTGITVSGAGQTGGTLTIGGLTNGDTFKAGQVFTLDGVDLIHPLTQMSYGDKASFVILEDVTAGGTTATVKIYPEISPRTVGAVKQANPNVTASPANGAALTFVGTADQFIDQALCFGRDDFTAAFAPLKVLAGCEGYTFNGSSMAMRVMTFGEGRTDQEGTRIDILYGFKAVRNNHAGRVGQPA